MLLALVSLAWAGGPAGSKGSLAWIGSPAPVSEPGEEELLTGDLNFLPPPAIEGFIEEPGDTPVLDENGGLAYIKTRQSTLFQFGVRHVDARGRRLEPGLAFTDATLPYECPWPYCGSRFRNTQGLGRHKGQTRN